MIMNDSLYHHGILGQRWGIRRFQNKDGTRTTAGKIRYQDDADERKSLKRKIRSAKAKKMALGIVGGSTTVALGYAAVGSVLTAGTATIPLMAASASTALGTRALHNRISTKQQIAEMRLSELKNKTD
jgi:hypothetical protein